MPATTPRGLPYPLPAEPVSAGADAIKALALAVDTTLRLAGGVALLTLANESFKQIAVALPAGRFAAPPALAVSSQANAFIVGCSGVSSTSFNVWCRPYNGTATSANVTVGWVATVAG